MWARGDSQAGLCPRPRSWAVPASQLLWTRVPQPPPRGPALSTPPAQHAHPRAKHPPPRAPPRPCLPAQHAHPGAQRHPTSSGPLGPCPPAQHVHPGAQHPQPHSPGPAPSTPLAQHVHPRAQHVHPRAQPPAPQGTGRAHVWRRGWLRAGPQGRWSVCPRPAVFPLFFHLFLSSFIEVRLTRHRAHPCEACGSVGFILSQVASGHHHADSDRSCRLRREPCTPCAVAPRALPPPASSNCCSALCAWGCPCLDTSCAWRLRVVASPTQRGVLSFPFRRPGACEILAPRPGSSWRPLRGEPRA